MVYKVRHFMQAMDALSLKAAANVEQVMKDAARAVKKALQFCGTVEQKLEFLQVASESLIERSVPLAAETSVASGAIHKMYTEAQDEVQRQVVWLQNPKAVAAPAISDQQLTVGDVQPKLPSKVDEQSDADAASVGFVMT